MSLKNPKCPGCELVVHCVSISKDTFVSLYKLHHTHNFLQVEGPTACIVLRIRAPISL